MNDIIKNELEKIRVPMSNYDDSTEFISIPRFQKIGLCLGKSYVIKVPDYIVHEPNGFALSANWNKGITPKTNYMKVTVLEKLGIMIKLDAIGMDNNTMEDVVGEEYKGLWLPEESIEIIKNL